jgi:hypothetical protein
VPRPLVLSRRAAVGGVLAAVAALVSACTRGGRSAGSPGGPSSPAPTTPSPTPGPDVTLAVSVLARERALLDRVVATLRAHPTTDAALRGARHAHQSHVRLLSGAVPGTPTPAETRTPPRRHQRVDVPPHAPAALAAVAAAEQRLAAAERGAGLHARSGPFARLLAGMAASAAQQSAHLGAAAREGRR